MAPQTKILGEIPASQGFLSGEFFDAGMSIPPNGGLIQWVSFAGRVFEREPVVQLALTQFKFDGSSLSYNIGISVKTVQVDGFNVEVGTQGGNTSVSRIGFAWTAIGYLLPPASGGRKGPKKTKGGAKPKNRRR